MGRINRLFILFLSLLSFGLVIIGVYKVLTVYGLLLSQDFVVQISLEDKEQKPRMGWFRSFLILKTLGVSMMTTRQRLCGWIIRRDVTCSVLSSSLISTDGLLTEACRICLSIGHHCRFVLSCIRLEDGLRRQHQRLIIGDVQRLGMTKLPCGFPQDEGGISFTVVPQQ